MGPNWFIGFPVDPENWYEKVITNVPAGIKSFNPADLHLTFAFLGAAGEAHAARAWESAVKLNLSRVCTTLGAAESFGNPVRPSAYAFTLEKGRDRIITYIKLHRDVLVKIAGRKPDRYGPRPHVTIARPPRNASEALRAEGAAWTASLEPPVQELWLDRIALYTWADDRAARQFKIVEAVVLPDRGSTQ